MTNYKQSYADRHEAPSSTFGSRRRTESIVARVVRMLNLAIADALYAYAMTGSAFATLVVLAAPHVEVFMCCVFHGKG